MKSVQPGESTHSGCMALTEAMAVFDTILGAGTTAGVRTHQDDDHRAVDTGDALVHNASGVFAVEPALDCVAAGAVGAHHS